MQLTPTKLKQQLEKTFNYKMNAWLVRRIPVSSEHQLSSQNIFILPSRFGIAFLLFILLLFLMATNYQNNLIMLFSYLMASLFITAMLKSFFNLSGLKVKAQSEIYGHTDTDLFYTISLSSQTPRYALNLQFDQQPKTYIPCCEVGTSKIKVSFQSALRGRYKPGRLRISSAYCFGLFTTWTRLDFNCQAIIYPKQTIITGHLAALSAIEESPQVTSSDQPGMDEFYQLKSYSQGEPLSRVAWKQFAKGQGKMSKEYQQQQGELRWLKLTDMPANHVEIKLQQLSYLIIEYSNMGKAFGVDLGYCTIAINTGAIHKQTCLTALADY